MTTNLGGPRDGGHACHVVSWQTSGGQPIPGTDVDHGVTTWFQLIDTMEQADASRPTFDLFDVDMPDGSRRRFRAWDHDGHEAARAFSLNP